MRADLPAGTVTFLFTDVEGSTKLLHELGADAYADALAEHRRVIREAVAAHGGVEVDTQGDAFFVAFRTAPDALAAAVSAREGLAIPVRMGLHSGTPLLTEEGYVGADVHRAARIAAAGHGGQILVSSSTAALVDAEQLHDLGPHRLKDLSAPERIYQLGHAEHPPLKTLHQTNLPITATPFLGRERELAEVAALQAQDGVGLVTLTGPGGTGKTRLAIQAAGLVADNFPDGVWWVPLAPLADAKLVLETAAKALGARDDLAEHIGDRTLLLLFDNFEHVLDAAGDVAQLRASCPNVKILVTSREPLHLSGEHEYAVPPFVPEEGVGFFLARARAVRGDIEASEAVGEICRRLDNLPLALELAAARVKALSTEELLTRLEHRLPLLTGGARDLPERQRTLRATIEWSHALLEPAEQSAFARLSVFAGGCTLADAEELADTGLDTLQSLVDKSLLRHSGGRFWMLETIREFATDRLELSGERTAQRAHHAERFLALAEEAEPHLPAYERGWIDRLEQEHDNLRAALDWFVENGDTQSALRLAGALAPFWYMRGYVAEGRRRLDALLELDPRPTTARGKALNGYASVADDETVLRRARVDEAVKLHTVLGDDYGLARSKAALASVRAYAGDMKEAQRLYEESAATLRALGDEHLAMGITRSVAWTYDELGEYERAKAIHEANLADARRLGNGRVEAVTLGALSMIATIEERIDDAIPLLRQSVQLHAELGDPLESAFDLARFGVLFAHLGSDAEAVAVVACYDAVCEQIGANVKWANQMNEETLATARRRLDPTVYAQAWERGRRLALDEGIAFALEHPSFAE